MTLSSVEAAAKADFEDETLKEVWGGPFNGQQYRQRIFEEVLEAFDVAAIVETGTFRGSTTEYMAERSGLPLFSCELNERYFHYAKMRLAKYGSVRLFHQDSRTFLKELFASRSLPNGPVFFYLDAHWGADLPLWDEINAVFGHRADAIVMVDDFRVPGDTGFGYDDYGRGNCLSVLDLRANLVADLKLFFPRAPSAAETGAKRGSVVLVRSEKADQVAQRVASLEAASWREAMLLDGLVSEGLRQEARLAVLAEAVARAEASVAELQSSRWRKLGLRLGLAKKATFER